VQKVKDFFTVDIEALDKNGNTVINENGFERENTTNGHIEHLGGVNEKVTVDVRET
jgi:hypothetical protein